MRAGKVLLVVLMLAGVPSAGFGAATEVFEKSNTVRSPEFLDKSAMELLVGATGKAPEPSPPEISLDSSKPPAEDVAGQLTPDLESALPGGFDETMDWVDYEAGAGEARDGADPQEDGFLDDVLNQDLSEGKAEPKGSEPSGEKTVSESGK